MQTDFDVIIVGAGPAGAASAISLARRGYAVALIDKEEFPREKLCGDFINPSNWPMLAQLGVTRDLFTAGSRNRHGVSHHCRLGRGGRSGAADD